MASPDGGKYALPEAVHVKDFEYEDIELCSAPVPPVAMDEMRAPGCCAGDVSDADMAKLLEAYKIELPAKKNENWPPTICTVPMELRRGDNNGCYDPVAVQIGLCKDGIETMMKNTEEFRKELPRELQDLEQYKSSCVVQLISRRPGKEKIAIVEEIHSLFRRGNCLFTNVEKIWACHSNPTSLGLDLDKLGTVRTMVTDGCFILHRLLKYAHLADKVAAKKKTTQGGEGGGVEVSRRTKKAKASRSSAPGSTEVKNDYGDDDWTQTGGRCFVWQLVTRDLLLLENQIPFLVVSELFKTLKNKNENNKTLVKGSLMLFRSLCPEMLPHSVSVSDIAKKLDGVHHLLHLFYLMVVGWGLQHPAGPGENKPGARATAKNGKTKPHCLSDDVLPSELPQWIPGTKELLEAGIRLKKRKNATTFLDIKFDSRSGVLEIPPLQLYDHSEPLFRNMIAFEQTYPHTRCDISIYSVFMSCLVSTAEDARILHLRGILVNMMNGGDPDGGRRFFDSICSQIHFPSDNYLVDTMAGVNKYIQSRHHRWRAALVRDYFSNPWVAISVVAAVFLLGLTVLQTFFTVYPYYKPSK